jgi:heme/copper-type cytochrome/quinol oxidase subunit 1
VPPLVRRYLRTAIAFLAVGLVIGAWMLAAREFGLALPARILSVHTHLLLVGFVMFMISGVALWMFPRAAKDDARYRPGLAEWAYWLLLAGTAVRAALELVAPAGAALPVRVVIVAGGLAQVAGLLLFFVMMLPRIRSTLSAPR